MIARLISAIFKTRGIIGVDISARSIKLSRVTPSSKKIKIKECGILPLALSENLPFDERISRIASELREFIKEKRIGCRNAVILLSGNDARIAYSKLDRRPDEDFAEACRKEAASLFFNTDDLFIDYDELGETSEDGITKVKVVFAAAKKSVIKEKILIAEQAGLEPVMIIPAAFAFERMLMSLYGKSDKNSLLVSLGRKYAGMYLYGDGRAEAVRNVAVESTIAESRIQSKLKVNRAAAEEIKKKYDFPVSEEEKAAVLDRFSKEESVAISAKKEYLDSLAAEIDPFVYLSDLKVSSILVTGGPAADSGIGRFIEEKLKLPARVFPQADDLSKSSINLAGKNSFSLMPASAASLSFASYPGLTRINLLPSGYEGFGNKSQKVFKTVFYVIIAAMAAAFFTVHGTVSGLKSELEESRAARIAAAVAASDSEISILKKEADSIAAYVGQAEEIKNSRALSAGLIKEVISSLPEGMHISGLSSVQEEDYLSVELKAIAKNAADAASWAESLSEKSSFSEVSAGTASKPAPSAGFYEMLVKFKYKGDSK